MSSKNSAPTLLAGTHRNVIDDNQRELDIGDHRSDYGSPSDFDYTGGRMVIKPLRFEGSLRKLNVDTGTAGSLQVGLLDEDMQPIEWFEGDDGV